MIIVNLVILMQVGDGIYMVRSARTWLIDDFIRNKLVSIVRPKCLIFFCVIRILKRFFWRMEGKQIFFPRFRCYLPCVEKFAKKASLQLLYEV